MPPGVIVRRGPQPLHDILQKLDGFFAQVDNALLRQVRNQLEAGDTPLCEMAQLITKDKSKLDHLRDDWFGDHDQGGAYWRNLKLQPVADRVRTGLVDAIDASLSVVGHRHLPIHSFWLEVKDTAIFGVTVFKGPDAVGMLILSPPAGAHRRRARKRGKAKK